MYISRFRLISAVLSLTVMVVSSSAQTAAASPAMQEADSLFQAQNWEEAARAYEGITKAEPTTGRAWFRLGYSQLPLSKYDQALAAFQHSLELAKGTPRAVFSMYGLASTYARMNEKDKAFEWLDKALIANLQQPRQIIADPNLANLHDDPRFPAIVARAKKAGMVCMNTPEYRQFDFWVGEWNVIAPNGQQVGTNSVKLLEDGCIIEENWTSAGGGTGKSFNFYNPTTRLWHQSYMDNSAGNWMMDGEYKDGALQYKGAIYSPGTKVLVHMTFFNLGPDKVRQWAETSMDDGKTWSVIWDAMYVRKK